MHKKSFVVGRERQIPSEHILSKAALGCTALAAAAGLFSMRVDNFLGLGAAWTLGMISGTFAIALHEAAAQQPIPQVQPEMSVDTTLPARTRVAEPAPQFV